MADDEETPHPHTPKKVPQCKATAKRTGKRCIRPVVPGCSVCRHHGGTAKQVRAAGHRRVLEAEAAESVRLFGGRRDIHPAQALLELVQDAAAEVRYWQERVAETQDHDSLLWHEAEAEETVEVTEAQTEAMNMTRTTSRERSEAGPAVELQLLHEAQERLARYAAASLKAGVDAAMVELAKTQAAQVVAVLQAALSDPRIGASPEVVNAVLLDTVRHQALEA